MSPIALLLAMPIPAVIAVLVLRKTFQLRRAVHWVEGIARITHSGVKAEHSRFQGEEQQVTNKVWLRYEFTVGIDKVEGTRISIGDLPPDGVEGTLKRYPVGASVPVFYDPRNPRDCVLDRKVPVSLGCLWGGAIVLLAIGLGVAYFISRSESLDETLMNAFPRIQHPLLMIFVSLMGVFCVMLFWAGHKQANAAGHWPVVSGEIVSSTAESFRMSISEGNTHRHTTMYRAAIEYRYRVHDVEYRGTRLRLGAQESTGAKAKAEEWAARYPVGKEIDVHYDPADPTSTFVEPGFAKGFVLLLLALALFGVATMAALKP